MIMNKSKHIGYILCESPMVDDPATKVVDETSNGRRVIAEGILQRANNKNRNGRYYKGIDLNNQLNSPRWKELLRTKTALGEEDHPTTNELSRQSVIKQKNACVMYLDTWMDGDLVWGRYRGTNNDKGETFDLDLRDGVIKAFSLRALGTINRNSTLNANVVENLRLITYDNVIFPSHPEAYTQRLVTESGIVLPSQKDIDAINRCILQDIQEMGGSVTPFNNQQVFDYIHNESGNLKYLSDFFDFAYSDITVNERGTKVSLVDKESGDIMVINMEEYVHNNLMDFATRFDNFI